MSDTVSGDMLAIASDLRAHGLYALATRLEVAAIKVRRQEHALDEVTRESFEEMQAMDMAIREGYIFRIRTGRD